MNKRVRLIIAVSIAAVAVIFAALGIKNYVYNSKARQLYQQACLLSQQKDYEAAVKSYEDLINGFSKSGFAAKGRMGLAEAYLNLGRLTEAREIYKDILSQEPDVTVAKAVYDKLGALNIKTLFSPVKTQDSTIYKVREGDTLQAVAQKYNTTVALIKRANNLKSEVIRPGKGLKVATAKFSIVVDKSLNTLTLKSGEDVVRVYQVSTGADNSTPVGTFKITNKIVDPPWFSSGKTYLPGDPKNILGSRWLGITVKGYGIHGTTDDATIGTQCTQGCVRMHNYDVEELYDIVPVGIEVVIVD